MERKLTLKNNVREPVRLVIWDLDDTLWKGVVTEGGILEHRQSNYEIVRELARRGIVSSICSKNDFGTIKTILCNQRMWDYFIFPSIDWSNKGLRVENIIQRAQLRPETVLFIDDNPSNRAEARALVPGLQVAAETIIDSLLADPLLKGKNDVQLRRLSQYKVLENKASEKHQAIDNVAFLLDSLIQVEIDHDCVAHIDRIVELVNRTNQLNFTKKRLSEDVAVARKAIFDQLDATSGRRSAVVKVKDRYGDYGVVGFWMMDGIWVEPYLIHFVFSCRTLGMGVEQWVYHRLGKPKVSIVGEVVSSLEVVPTWINLARTTPGDNSETAIEHVRLRGGCELEVVKHFFSFRSSHVNSDFVFPRNGQVVWKSHSITIFPQPALETSAGLEAIHKIGFIKEDMTSAFLSDVEEGACLVLSNTADAQAAMFRHRKFDLVVPVKLFGLDVTSFDDAQLNQYCSDNNMDIGSAREFRNALIYLRENFVPIQFEEFDFKALYGRIADAMPLHSLLIFLLPVTYANSPDGGIIEYRQQKIVNRWLAELSARHENVKIVDTADCLTSLTELKKFSHLHFSRDVYFRMYNRLVDTYGMWRSSRATSVG